MSYDTVELVKGCLQKLGLDDLATGLLDNGTITIDIDKRPSINISQVENKVTFWATLCPLPEAFHGRDAELDKYQAVNTSHESFAAGQPSIEKTETNIELLADLQPAALKSEDDFGVALELFFNHLVAVDEILNK